MRLNPCFVNGFQVFGRSAAGVGAVVVVEVVVVVVVVVEVVDDDDGHHENGDPDTYSTPQWIS